MKTFIFDLFNKVKRTSEALDAKTIICNKTWRVFTDGTEKEVYIFMEDGKLVISYNGIVTMGSWMYIPANHSLVISGNNQNFLVHPVLCNNMLALIVDGTNQCAFLLDDTQNEQKRLNSLENITEYICKYKNTNTNQLASTNETNSITNNTDNEYKPIDLERCQSFKGSGGYEFVDLGLSVFWAWRDLGSFTPKLNGKTVMYGDGYGDKLSDYNCSKVKWLNEVQNSPFNWNFDFDIRGKHGLDAATTRMGRGWRMPSYKEFEELINRCKWTFIEDKSENECYIKITGPSGRFIYLMECRTYLCGDSKVKGDTGTYSSFNISRGTSLPSINTWVWKYGQATGLVRAVRDKAGIV